MVDWRNILRFQMYVILEVGDFRRVGAPTSRDSTGQKNGTTRKLLALDVESAFTARKIFNRLPYLKTGEWWRKRTSNLLRILPVLTALQKCRLGIALLGLTKRIAEWQQKNDVYVSAGSQHCMCFTKISGIGVLRHLNDWSANNRVTSVRDSAVRAPHRSCLYFKTTHSLLRS